MSDKSTQILQSLRGNLQKVTQYVRQIESIEQKIGTPKDSHELRSSLVKFQNESKNLLSICQADLKQLHSLNESKTGELKIQKERVTDELFRTISNVQKCVKSAMDKQKRFELPTSAAFYSNNRSTSDYSIDPAEMMRNYNNNNNVENVLEQQQQVQRTKSVELQLVAERRDEMKKLESDIGELAQIFKDMATLVHDQSYVIDTIENNMEITGMHVENARDLTLEAKHLNTKARKKKMCIWLIVIMFLVVLAIVLFFALRPYF